VLAKKSQYLDGIDVVAVRAYAFSAMVRPPFVLAAARHREARHRYRVGSSPFSSAGVEEPLVAIILEIAPYHGNPLARCLRSLLQLNQAVAIHVTPWNARRAELPPEESGEYGRIGPRRNV
jgi:hypothetical protein